MTLPSFPDPPNGYPTLERGSTDRALPPTARSWNNSRYAYFRTVAKGTRYHVQRCTDLHFAREVCHKSLREELALDPVHQQLLLREARLTSQLQHPSLPTVYEIGKDKSGQLFFTCAPIVGSTLREMIDSLLLEPGVAADLEFVAETIIRIALALDFAHLHGVIHRGLTPENVVSGFFGEINLLGWEVAHLVTGTMQPSKQGIDLSVELPIQPSRYLAPELVQGSCPTPACDVFSLGAILFELLSTNEPSQEAALGNMLSRVQESKATAPLNVEFTQLEAICLRCVANEPERRFTSMQEVIQAIRCWKEHRKLESGVLEKVMG